MMMDIASWSPRMLSALRIVTGLLFLAKLDAADAPTAGGLAARRHCQSNKHSGKIIGWHGSQASSAAG
jgi:hypothetical protein